MSETPSWLTEENVAVASVVASNPTAQKIAKNAAVAHAKEKGYLPPDEENQARQAADRGDGRPEGMTDEEFAQMKKYHTFLRVGYIGASILMGVAAAYKILNTTSVSLIFIACYVFFFSVIICCFEAALKGISRALSQNFGFMYSLGGKLTFLIFVAILCYSLGAIGIAAMCVLLLLCIGNAYTLLKFSGYEKWLRESHYNQIKEGVNQ
jgi:hypothetical protein